MRGAFTLFIADLRRNCVYYAIAVLGVSAAVAGVVWNHGSFATGQHQYEAYGQRLMGTYDMFLCGENLYRRRSRDKDKSKERPDEINIDSMVAWLKKHPGVTDVDAAFAHRVILRHKLPWTGPSLRAVMFAIDPAVFSRPKSLAKAEWLPQGTEGDRCIVIDRQQADRMRVKIGDMVGITGPATQVELKVCGIVDATRPFGRSGHAYVTSTAAARVMGNSDVVPNPNLAAICCNRPETKNDLIDAPEVKASGLQVIDSSRIGASLRGGRRGFDNLGLYLILLSLAVSLLIVFITLNLGRSKRLRQFGMLRSIGASRFQISGIIALESALMGVLGSACGIALGALVLWTTTRWNPALFPNGVMLGRSAIAWGVFCGLAGAIFAAVPPILLTLRQTPLTAITGSTPRRHTLPLVMVAIVGVLLLLPAMVLSLPLNIPSHARAILSGYLGLPGILAGCLLLTPLLVLVMAQLLTGPLAALIRLPRQLVSTEMSSHLTRKVAVTLMIAMSVGSFVSVATWGATMLRPFMPNEDCPDVVITFRPNGLSSDFVEQVQNTPGLAPGKCQPLYTRQIDLGEKTKKAIRENEIIEVDMDESDEQSVLLVGVDANKVLFGEEPLLNLNLQSGETAAAVAKINGCGYCLIPASFAAQSQLAVGDSLQLGSPSEPDIDPSDRRTQRSFMIAGIYTSPWHLLTKKAGMRGMHGSSYSCQAMVIVSAKDAKPMMRDERITTFWANYDSNYRAMSVAHRMETIRPDLEEVARRCGPSDYKDPTTGEKVKIESAWVNLGDLGYVIDGVENHAGNIIDSRSRLPLWSLSIAALAIVNTIITSVRMRRWTLGVLRSIGMSASQLMRMILAETILIVSCGSLLGLASGLYAGWTSARMAHYIFHFSGIDIQLVVPWSSITLGLIVAMALSTLAAIWPAVSISRTHPLTLLQQGRSRF